MCAHWDRPGWEAEISRHYSWLPTITNGDFYRMSWGMAFSQPPNTQSARHKPLSLHGTHLTRILRSEYLFKLIFYNLSHFRVLECLPRKKQTNQKNNWRLFPFLETNRRCFIDCLIPWPTEPSHNQQGCPGIFQLLYQRLHLFPPECPFFSFSAM